MKNTSEFDVILDCDDFVIVLLVKGDQMMLCDKIKRKIIQVVVYEYKRSVRFLNRDKRIFVKEKVIPNQVNLEHCLTYNVGDSLGPVIVKWMLDKKNIDPMKTTTKTARLMTVGSLAGLGYSDVVLWGSGVHLSSNVWHIHKWQGLQKIDIRAVRGPLTRAIYKSAGYSCPAVYGDPAILMPLIYKKTQVISKYDVSIIVHCHNKAIVESGQYKHLNFIDVATTDYEKFIDEIVSSKKIIASSLHGIILSEAYGVPSVFLNTGGYVDTALIKYYDWYLSTGRADSLKIANSIEDALLLAPMKLPDLQEMQQNLMDAFPYDLWR